MKKSAIKKYLLLRNALQAEKAQIESRLQAVNYALGGQIAVAEPRKARRKMSAAGRARIAAGQRARWAKLKAGKK